MLSIITYIIIWQLEMKFIRDMTFVLFHILLCISILYHSFGRWHQRDTEDNTHRNNALGNIISLKETWVSSQCWRCLVHPLRLIFPYLRFSLDKVSFSIELMSISRVHQAVSLTLRSCFIYIFVNDSLIQEKVNLNTGLGDCRWRNRVHIHIS